MKHITFDCTMEETIDELRILIKSLKAAKEEGRMVDKRVRFFMDLPEK